MSSKRHGSKHHIIPRSRGGEDTSENIIEIDLKSHGAWHTLFGNLLLEEVITLVKHRWFDKKGRIDKRYLKGKKRQEAWHVLFGGAGSEAIIQIIIKRFSKWAN